MASKRDAFSANPKGSMKVRNRVALGKRTSCGVSHGGEVLRPIAVAISILTTQPPDKITIDEMEAKEGARMGTGSTAAQMQGRVSSWWKSECM